MTAGELSTMSEPAAREALAACCGAAPWVEAMLATRPWSTAEALLAAADRTWAGLSAESVALAIRHHPRLGESRATAAVSERSSRWSAEEQTGTKAADATARDALARANEEYEHRFGHTFILCASGLSVTDMLAALRDRLMNDPATEHANTARELHRITRLRLEKLLGRAAG